MRKHLLALAMAVASFGLVAQGGTANAFLLGDRSPNVTAGQIIAGGGMTAAYFALSPIIGGALVSYNERRELKSSEVFMMLGDCVVPIIGGWVMKAAFDANP